MTNRMDQQLGNYRLGNLQNHSSPSNLPLQQFNSSQPPQFNSPSPQSWSSPIQSGMTPGQFPPQGPQENKRGGKKSNKGLLVAIIALLVLLVAAASAGGIYVLVGQKTPSTGGVGQTLPTATSTLSSQPGTSTTPASVSTASTSVPTSSIPTATPTLTSSNYSAIQPGPGCDKNGGTWTPQGFSNITCGTQLTPATIRTQAYLYLQLPQNQAFSSDNSIGITGGNLGGAPNDITRTGNCLGLAEQDASTGFLAEYCATGAWLIYSISSNGAIVQVLAKGLTSTRTSEILLLTFKGATLSFSIDGEVHSISITPIQPTKVAIADDSDTDAGFSPGTISVENFNYIKLSS